MSYLLDALRKAEHERKLGSVPDLSTEVDGPEASAHALPVWLPWAIGAAVVLNLTALGAMAWWWSAASGTSEARTAEAGSVLQTEPATAKAGDNGPRSQSDMASANPGADLKANVASNRAGRTGSNDEPEQPIATDVGSSPGTDPGQIAAETPRAEEPARAASEPQPGPISEPSPEPESSAIASAPPATQSATGTPDEVKPLRALPSQVRNDIPALKLNGHLYSSIPGRSFVLINGSRYHEGERLADGGAVESIDAAGVVINHEGQRFRLSAPN